LTAGSCTQYLRRPNTVAFIVEGEILSEMAQVLDPTLAQWFARGPFLQVSKYAAGTRFLEVSPRMGGPSQVLMADSVMEAEKLILVGFLKGRNDDSDQTLFPTPTIFEQYSDHTPDMVRQGMLWLIKHLLKEAHGANGGLSLNPTIVAPLLRLFSPLRRTPTSSGRDCIAASPSTGSMSRCAK
jgi:hypothetical protein